MTENQRGADYNVLHLLAFIIIIIRVSLSEPHTSCASGHSRYIPYSGLFSEVEVFVKRPCNVAEKQFLWF